MVARPHMILVQKVKYTTTSNNSFTINIGIAQE